MDGARFKECAVVNQKEYMVYVRYVVMMSLKGERDGILSSQKF